MKVEETNFIKCGENKSGIHSNSCYTMFPENQSGLAKIITTLRLYHSPKKLKGKYETPFEAGFVESFVGEPHLVCECLDRLQFLRFQTLCDMKFIFSTPTESQNN